MTHAMLWRHQLSVETIVNFRYWGRDGIGRVSE